MDTFDKILEQVHDDETIISKEEIKKRFSRRARIYVNVLCNIAALFRNKGIGKCGAKMFAKEYIKVKEKLYSEYMDYSKISELLREGCEYPHTLEKRYKFFYDETNNYRVFHIKDGKFNESPTKYFVLGGVCFNSKTWPDFSEMESQLCLQSNMAEIKARHIFRKKNFIERIGEKRLNVILRWLEKENCFLHMEAVDHLEKIAGDIAEMCVAGTEKDGKELLLGNTIYKAAKKDIDSFTKLLAKYDFPNINEKEWSFFCGELIRFISIAGLREKVVDIIDRLGRRIGYEYPISMLKEAQGKKLKYDMGNKIIESYKLYYLYKPLIFINSIHVYDMEPEIWEKMKNETIYVDGKVLNNYAFMDSKVNNMIQVSDVVVSLLASFLDYVNSFEVGKRTLESIQNIGARIKTPLQRENFCLLMKILRQSEKENECFIRVHGNFVNKNALSFLMSVTRITDEAVSFIPKGVRK